jgi:hypothetical protein
MRKGLRTGLRDIVGACLAEQKGNGYEFTTNSAEQI